MGNTPTSFEEILAWELSDIPAENAERAFLGMQFIAKELAYARGNRAVAEQALDSNWDPRGERRRADRCR